MKKFICDIATAFNDFGNIASVERFNEGFFQICFPGQAISYSSEKPVDKCAYIVKNKQGFSVQRHGYTRNSLITLVPK
jgi:hypothetical protein